MNKKVLAIYYTQSGQFTEIIDSLTAPLVADGASLEKVIIKPVVDFNFPWTGKRFFSVMPDCVLGVATELEPVAWNETAYDLIILGYQPWFLSPSIPSNSLLSLPEFRALLKDTPVITVSAARNMWLNAYDRIRKSLNEAGANLVGNIALIDKHPNPVSFITIFYWMLSGKKERYFNIFPKPGVSEEDIKNTKIFGETIGARLQTGNWHNLQQELLDQKA